MYEGEIVGMVDTQDADAEQLGLMMAGGNSTNRQGPGD
jgi:hypothetical protein